MTEEVQRIRKCIKPKHWWTEKESDTLLQSIIDIVKDEPDKFEKPTVRKFYENLFKSSDNPVISVISELGWKVVKSKIRNLKIIFIETKEWMNETGVELLKDGKEQYVRDYILKRCPHYDKLKQLFGQEKEEITEQPNNELNEVTIETTNVIDCMSKSKEADEESGKTEMKCGEFFLSKSYNSWKVKCIFCVECYNEITEFIAHVKLNHLENENSFKNCHNYYEAFEMSPVINTVVVKEEPELQSSIYGSNQFLEIELDNNEENSKKDDLSNSNTELVSKEIKIQKRKRKKKTNRIYSDIACDICERNLLIDEGIQKHRLYYHNFKDSFVSNANSPLENDKRIPKSDNETKRIDALQCNFCSHRSNSAGARLIHERTHTGEKPHACNICQKRFLSERTMLAHQEGHNTANKTFKYCEICRFKVTSMKQLSEHMIIHSEDEQIKCKYCSKTFLRKRYRDLHERTHTGERSLQCTDCGKTFIRAEHLIVHTRYHTGTKPYKCTYCDKSFYTNTYLKDHLVVHTGERPFPCDVCGKTFARRKNLKVHLRTHSNVREYICQLCGKSFKHQGALAIHRKTHDGMK